VARRQLLSDEVWARPLEPPAGEREIARHYTLGPDEMAQLAAKRGDANRLGYALVLLYLRHPGRALEAGEAPPEVVLAYIARPHAVPASAYDDDARRDATRRAHLAEAMRAGGYAPFDRAAASAAVAFLTAAAQTIVRPGQLAGILVEELRRRRVALPSSPVLEAVGRRARQRAERLGHEGLTAGLAATALARLDALLEPRPTGKLTGSDGSGRRRSRRRRRTCPSSSTACRMCGRSGSTALAPARCRCPCSSAWPTRRRGSRRSPLRVSTPWLVSTPCGDAPCSRPPRSNGRKR